jgi:hypothetical protein
MNAVDRFLDLAVQSMPNLRPGWRRWREYREAVRMMLRDHFGLPAEAADAIMNERFPLPKP